LRQQLRRELRHLACTAGREGGKGLAVAVIQHGQRDLVLHDEGRKGLFGRYAVGIEQGGHAVDANHVRQRSHLPRLVFRVAEHGGQGESGKDQQQRAAGGQHGDDGQFPAQAGTFKVKHVGTDKKFQKETLSVPETGTLMLLYVTSL
jgi:hypothetical protein